MRPRTKRDGYLINGAGIAAGGLMLGGGLAADCSNMGFSGGLNCELGSLTIAMNGMLLLALGGVGTVITAASDVPSE